VLGHFASLAGAAHAERFQCCGESCGAVACEVGDGENRVSLGDG